MDALIKKRTRTIKNKKSANFKFPRKLTLTALFAAILISVSFVCYRFVGDNSLSGCSSFVQAAVSKVCPLKDKLFSGVKPTPPQESPRLAPEISRIFVKSDQKTLTLYGKNLQKVEVFAKTQNIERLWGEARKTGSDSGFDVWSFELPQEPILVREIFAKAQPKDFRESFVFMSLPITGFVPIYQMLWAETEKSVFNLELNQSQKLFSGQTTILSSGEVAVSFKEAIDDSRCPFGAYCFWAGKVSAKLNLDFSNQLPIEVILSLDPNNQTTSFYETGKYKINLVSVGPEKQLNQPQPAKEDYYVFVSVSEI